MKTNTPSPLSPPSPQIDADFYQKLGQLKTQSLMLDAAALSRRVKELEEEVASLTSLLAEAHTKLEVPSFPFPLFFLF